jgi:hypothetical protein
VFDGVFSGGFTSCKEYTDMSTRKSRGAGDAASRRSVSDAARGVTYFWAETDDLRSGRPLPVLPLDIPGGYPAGCFVMLQDKSDLNLQEGFSQRAVAKGISMGKQTIFVRVDCSVRIERHLKAVKDPSVWDGLEFLAIDELNLDNRYLLWDKIMATVKSGGARHADHALLNDMEAMAKGETNVVDAFIANPSLVGYALFGILPNLRLLSWDVSVMGEGLPRLNALAFRDMDVVSNVEAFAHGHGFVEVPLELCMPGKEDEIMESNRYDYYMPWV